MSVAADNPLIVQSDRTVLLEVASPRAEQARTELARFAELERAPEHLHTYRVTDLALWNAAAAGLTPDEVAATLTEHAKYPVPDSLLAEVREQMSRHGRLRIVRDFDSGALALTSDEPSLLLEVQRDEQVAALVGQRLDGNRHAVRLGDRGTLKQALLRLGWPAADTAGYVEGTPIEAELRAELRGYQADALSSWWAGGSEAGGSGCLVLPCGSGKTVIGLAALVQAGVRTLVLTTSISAARQWVDELLDKTDLGADRVTEYTGEHKAVADVTVATYQVLTWRRPDDGADVARDGSDGTPGGGRAHGLAPDRMTREQLHTAFPHLALLDAHGWGLVVYDEVHLLPAPVFRATAQIQAVRRLGLTATLVREDGREHDVFSLIGPKRYDAPWRELEAAGWIAPAVCTEVRVDLPDDERLDYAVAASNARYRLAATTRAKLHVVDALAARHDDEQVLVIGQYLDQLRDIATLLGAPLVTGRTGQAARDERFGAFRAGELDVLVVSKVANVSIDLPDAGVAIQVSGTFGSRQEEAQRLGRILRPKRDGRQAHFYTVVTRDTVDQQFAARRQRFLTEQGYRYELVDAADLRP